MFSLVGDIKFWSCDDNINLKNTDFSAFRYYDKRIDGIYDEAKRSYCQKRDIIYNPQNKKGNKLKDGLKYLEEQLKDYTIIFCQWYDQSTIQMMLNTGLLITIQVNLSTIDIENMSFDKYLIGKVPDHISDAVITKDHLICTHTDSQITIVNFGKPKRQLFDKINKLEAKLMINELSGPCGRRIEKKIRVNKSGDLILIWWKSTTNEVYPWSPAMKEHDRANVHLYRLRGLKFELLCYLRTEFDPLCITFNSKEDNVIHSIEQKVSRKGDVTIEWQTYEVSQQDKLQRIEMVSIPLPTHTSCSKFSPNQDMLLLCCIDGTITLHDHSKGTNKTIKTTFIATIGSWHNDGYLFTIGNERGQYQHYDISLSCVKSQMLNEESSPTNIHDLSIYFKTQSALLKIDWNKKLNITYNDKYKNNDSLILLLFEKGPICITRIIEGNNLSGDTLIYKYLNIHQPERATNILLSMNWDLNSRSCMYSLNQILNYLFKYPLNTEREILIQNALGSFHVPITPISQIIEDEYADEIRDLTRKFFHHLMRYKLFDKAFRLAIDLNDHDLFMDINFYALSVNDISMAKAAKDKAELLLSRSNSCTSTHSTCSRPSCSLCSDSISENDSESYTEESESEDSPRRRKFKKILTQSQIPPLPILATKNYDNNLVSTSFNDETTSKNSDNTLSTNFNDSNYKLTSGITKFSSSSFGKSNSYKLKDDNHEFKNIHKDDLSSSFRNLRVNNHYKRENFFKKTTNDQQLIDTDILREQKSNDNDFLTTSFDSSHSIEIPNSVEYSFMNVDNNAQRLLNNENNNSFDTNVAGIDEKSSNNFINLDNNLVSTSFNEEGDNTIIKNDKKLLDNLSSDIEIDDENLNREGIIEVPPPPPAMTKSLENYLNNLPKKNIQLSKSTPGLSCIDDTIIKFQKQKKYYSSVLQNSQSVSTILQNQDKKNHITKKTYRFNYDLDCVQYSGSCDNLNGQEYSSDRIKSSIDSRFLKNDDNQIFKNFNREFKAGSNVPPLPVINSPEKPKVKFSNTVTHILVPGTGQPYRPIQKRPATKLHQMDPKRELAESLPLCLGNEDYLKDFQPLSNSGDPNNPMIKEPIKTEEAAKIKVVHFGLL
ncbi:WD repeat-containing and planar cell polarity effector protein fritz isoform X2 [Aphidius gifuensis]|uniref:WD repeat-containing and planar cell polarity effector protein fritz isoform X2 n=1 Tax=Aphidius gifuensis TaxID=684658 RepID=UPI001CDC1B3F|nr:WD repeat-containing and planar cell polarity effector protein fritz isoform X2 [Aphidius gifuensis]